MKPAAACLALCLLCVSAAGSAAAPPEVPAARLAGSGSFRWFGLKIYDAQLWTGEAGYQGDSAPFALELRYARTLRGKKIADASLDEIKKLGLGTTVQHESWLAAMTRLFPDVQEGSRITGVYLPPGLARFYLDDKLLGEVNDPAFARAFFAIWLDPRTTAPELRNALLHNAAGRP